MKIVLYLYVVHHNLHQSWGPLQREGLAPLRVEGHDRADILPPGLKYYPNSQMIKNGFQNRNRVSQNALHTSHTLAHSPYTITSVSVGLLAST